MRIESTKAGFTARADVKIRDGLKAKAAFRKRRAGQREYLDGTHRVKLVGNQEDLGEECVMVGRNVKAINDSLREDFIIEVNREIAAGVKFGQGKAVLKRWVVVERNVTAENADVTDGVLESTGSE